MSQKIGDPSFGLNRQARALLAMLAEVDPDFAPWNKERSHYECRISSYPMYNGREKGVCLVVEKGYIGSFRGEHALHIFFAEHRNSDAIRFWIWEAVAPFNAPEFPADREDIELRDKYVDYGRMDDAVKFIWKLCEDFFREEKEASKGASKGKVKIEGFGA